MADTTNRVTLHTQQADAVLEALRRDGAAFSSMAYIRRKYAESAPVFEAAYSWFVREAEKLVPRPQGAGTPYWAFQNPDNISGSGDNILTLCVPAEEAVFFDMHDWTRVLQLGYLGETPEQEAAFRQELAERGIRKESDILLTSFYPDLKLRIHESWQRLFRHHKALQAGEDCGVCAVQAALWQIKAEWICDGMSL